MGGPCNTINKPKTNIRLIKNRKRQQAKANPPTKRRGSFHGGMSKKKSKGVVKKRKFNVKTNTTPSGKRLRKLMKARLRNEKEVNDMQVEFTSTSRKQSGKRRQEMANTKTRTPTVSTRGDDVEMKDV